MTPEAAAERDARRSRRTVTRSERDAPVRALLEDESRAARERNNEAKHARASSAPEAEVRVTGFRSLMPLLRGAMIRLHPDAAAARAPEGRDNAEEALRNLLRAMGALEVLAVEPAGTVAELTESLRRRRPGAVEDRPPSAPGSPVLGTSLLGQLPIEVKVWTASGEDRTVRLRASASLVAATKVAERAAVDAARAGRRPSTAQIGLAGAGSPDDGSGAVAGPETTLLLGPAVVDSVALASPAVRARWLEAAREFVARLGAALELPKLADAPTRLASPVRRLLHAPADDPGAVGFGTRHVPEAARIGLQGRRRNLSPAERIAKATDARPAQSLGKVYPNPVQPLDQGLVTEPRVVDETVARMTSPEVLEPSLVDDARFQAGARTLTVVLYHYFEALQLPDPFWRLVRLVIGVGYDWVPSTRTVYLPWDMRTREAATYLRDLAPGMLAELRRQTRDDMRSEQSRREEGEAASELRHEVQRQGRARERRAREAGRGRSPWAGEWGAEPAGREGGGGGSDGEEGEGAAGEGRMAAGGSGGGQADAAGPSPAAARRADAEESDAERSEALMRGRPAGGGGRGGHPGVEADGEEGGAAGDAGFANPRVEDLLRSVVREQARGPRRGGGGAARRKGEQVSRLDRAAMAHGWSRA